MTYFYININLLAYPIIEIIDALFKKIKIFYPPEAEMKLIVDWLIKGLSGEKLTIFSPICPDYATVQTGNKECPIQFTFEYLARVATGRETKMLKPIDDLIFKYTSRIG